METNTADAAATVHFEIEAVGQKINGSTASFKITPLENIELKKLTYFPKCLLDSILDWANDVDKEIVYVAIGREKIPKTEKQSYLALIKWLKESGADQSKAAFQRKPAINIHEIFFEGHMFSVVPTLVGKGPRYAAKLLDKVQEVVFLDGNCLLSVNEQKFLQIDEEEPSNKPIRSHIFESVGSLRQENEVRNHQLKIELHSTVFENERNLRSYIDESIQQSNEKWGLQIKNMGTLSLSLFILS